jgi:hypothetical protein
MHVQLGDGARVSAGDCDRLNFLSKWGKKNFYRTNRFVAHHRADLVELLDLVTHPDVPKNRLKIIKKKLILIK